jgi:hypothetical protein
MADTYRHVEPCRSQALLNEGKKTYQHQGGGNLPNNVPVGHSGRESLAFER